MPELTQAQLEELVVGKTAPPRAVFFEQATLDPARSKAEGRRVYNKNVYIKLTAPGTTDWQSYIAQKSDIREYADEYAFFMQNRQGERLPGIEIIPGLDIIHKQELIDYGISNIYQLANAELVPAHLEYAKRAALTLCKAMEDLKHANQEESIEESGEIARAREELPQASRPNNIGNQRRFEPSGVQSSNGGRDPARDDEARQQHGSARPEVQRKDLNPREVRHLNDNWKVDLVWRA